MKIKLLTLFSMFLCVLSLSLAAINGKEKWEHAIDEISDIGAASDSEIYCIIASQGFEQLDVFDNPSTLDFIMAGIKDTSTCSCNCVKN